MTHMSNAPGRGTNTRSLYENVPTNGVSIMTFTHTGSLVGHDFQKMRNFWNPEN